MAKYIVLIVALYVLNAVLYLTLYCKTKKEMKINRVSWSGTYDIAMSAAFIAGLIPIIGTIYILILIKYEKCY